MTTPDPARYVRSVYIADHFTPDQADKPGIGGSVHATDRVIFDGVPLAPGVVDTREGWTAHGEKLDGTVLTLHVLPEHLVDEPRGPVHDNGFQARFRSIAGHAVVTPRVDWPALDGDPNEAVPVEFFVGQFGWGPRPAPAPTTVAEAQSALARARQDQHDAQTRATQAAAAAERALADQLRQQG